MVNVQPWTFDEFEIDIDIEMENKIIESIKTRRSIRKFLDRQVNDDELNTVLDAGTYAPTGKNSQDPIIIAVQNPEIRSELVRMNAGILGIDSDPYYNAPTIVLVFAPAPEDNRNSVPDGSLVLGTMMLAAHAIGLASCWINREREMFSTEEGKALMKTFGVPENYIGIGALALGYPAIPNPKALPRKENYYKIIK